MTRYPVSDHLALPGETPMSQLLPPTWRARPLLPLLRLLFMLVTLAGGTAAAPAGAQTQFGGVSGFVLDDRGNEVRGATIRTVFGPDAGRRTTSLTDGSY